MARAKVSRVTARHRGAADSRNFVSSQREELAQYQHHPSSPIVNRKTSRFEGVRSRNPRPTLPYASPKNKNTHRNIIVLLITDRPHLSSSTALIEGWKPLRRYYRGTILGSLTTAGRLQKMLFATSRKRQHNSTRLSVLQTTNDRAHDIRPRADTQKRR